MHFRTLLASQSEKYSLNKKAEKNESRLKILTINTKIFGKTVEKFVLVIDIIFSSYYLMYDKFL